MSNDNKCYVQVLPSCDFCGDPASVDGKTIHGPWANMCDKHFNMWGVGLGIGKGQLLVALDEKEATK